MPMLSRSVFAERLLKVQELMRRYRLDALAFMRADMVEFVTNFSVDVETWERPIVVVMTLNGDVFAVLNELSTGHIYISKNQNRLWIDEADIHFYAEHPRLEQRLPLLPQWPELVAELLMRKGLGFSRIGSDTSSDLLSRAVSMLPGASLHPMFSAISTARWQKHAEELANMRALASLMDWVQDRYLENIRPGRLIQELDCAMASLFVTEGAKRFPGEDLRIRVCNTLSGPSSASPHGDGAQCGATIQSGHGLVNAVIPYFNGSIIENERTFFCGKPSLEQRKLFETAAAASDAGVEVAIAGRPLSGIDVAAMKVIEAAGLSRHVRHRAGHPMGIMHHEFPSDMAFNHRPLLDNEVYSVEPGLYIDGLGGFRIDNSIVVGVKPEILTKSTYRIEDVSV